MYFIPWSDAFLLAKTAVETLDWLPLATLDKPRKEDVNNLEAIANKSIFFNKNQIFQSLLQYGCRTERGTQFTRGERDSIL